MLQKRLLLFCKKGEEGGSLMVVMLVELVRLLLFCKKREERGSLMVVMLVGLMRVTVMVTMTRDLPSQLIHKS